MWPGKGRFVGTTMHNNTYWRVTNASRSLWGLTKNFLQSSNMVSLVQLRGTLLPKLGKRWMLRLIFAIGIIDEVFHVRSRVWIAYNPWSRWGLLGKGENQSTYARCWGGRVPFGKKSGRAFSDKLRTTRIRPTRCSKNRVCSVIRILQLEWRRTLDINRIGLTIAYQHRVKPSNNYPISFIPSRWLYMNRIDSLCFILKAKCTDEFDSMKDGEFGSR